MSNKVKTKEDITKVRELYEGQGLALKAISKELNYSINTVRKIIRHAYGYEGDKFNPEDRWTKRKKKNTPEYTSEIDGETLNIQKSNTKDGYNRITTPDKTRETIHTYEAKKLYRLLDLEWKDEFIVHHIDADRSNYLLSNLSIFPSGGIHMQYHHQMERVMYDFLVQNNLLTKFYLDNPQLKLITLKEMLKENDKLQPVS